MTGKIQSLNVRNKTFIITTGKVDQNDVFRYLKKQVRERRFFKGSVFKIFSGAHGYRDGRLGDWETDTKQLKCDIDGQLQMYEDDVIDVLEDKNLAEDPHEHFGASREASGLQILENIESKNLWEHMRNAISQLREDEEIEHDIEEMEYDLSNP